MQFLKRFLPKGSGPKGFESVAQTPTQKPDTSYLDDLVRHESAGILRSFSVSFEGGKTTSISCTGKWGRRKEPDEIKPLIHDLIQTGASLSLAKCVEKTEGAKPTAVYVASFFGGKRVEPSTVQDNHETPDQFQQEHPGIALDQ